MSEIIKSLSLLKKYVKLSLQKKKANNCYFVVNGIFSKHFKIFTQSKKRIVMD